MVTIEKSNTLEMTGMHYISGITQSMTFQDSVFRVVLCCVFLDYDVL